MLQKSLRRLTRTTFLLTPKALSATLLLKMNREVFNVAPLNSRILILLLSLSLSLLPRRRTALFLVFVDKMMT